jgi:hypothetical protein
MDAKYRTAAVQKFAKRMAQELAMNAYKGDWTKGDVYEQVDEIMYHVAKLVFALEADHKQAIGEYAADVANHALIVADRMGVLDEPASKPTFIVDVTNVPYNEIKDTIESATDSWREALLDMVSFGSSPGVVPGNETC